METIAQQIFAVSEKYADKTAFIYYEKGLEKRTSYKQFMQLVKAFSQAIDEQNIPSHSIILLVAENSPGWPAAYLGAHCCGHTLIHGDIGYTQTQFETITEFAKPSLIITEKNFASYFPKVKKILFFEDIRAKSDDTKISIQPLKPGQPMSMIFTSGTTGNPKGVMLSEENFLSNLKMFSSLKGLITSTDKVVAILPLHHVYPFTCTVLVPLYFGATLIYPASLKGEDIFKAVKIHNGTILVAIPRVLELFCKKVFDTIGSLPQRKKLPFLILYSIAAFFRPWNINLGKIFFHLLHEGFPSFRYFSCGGARLDIDVHKKLTTLGFTIVEAYGLTETSPIAAMNSIDNPVPGSVGKAAPGVEISIAKKINEDSHGEILIKGPNVMMGYYQRADLTEKAVTDGWFHTGDLGYLDSQGSLFIAGRKDEMIVLSNGKNIYPEELEKIYLQSKMMKELCIVLLKGQGKESLTAVVYPNKEYFIQHKIISIYQDIKFDLETIGQNLPPYQRISRIELIETELPKTSLGKIKRYQVAESLRQKLLSAIVDNTIEEETTQDPFLMIVKDILRMKKVPELSAHLETDLGLDSLAKLEFVSSIEKKFKVKFFDEQAVGIFTLKDLKKLIPQKVYTDEDLLEEISLKSTITSPPEPPLDKHVSVGNKIFEVIMRYCIHLIGKIIFTILFHVQVEGKENMEMLPFPYIIAPNHVSFIDGLLIGTLFPFKIINQCYFVSIPKYFSTFPLSLIRKPFRVILTGTQDTAVRSLQYFYQALASKKIMCVFPEGGRSISGNIEGPKRGIGYVAKYTNAPLVPVYIQGSKALYSRENPGFHKTTITVKIFPPIFSEGPVEDFLSSWQKVLQNYHDNP